MDDTELSRKVALACGWTPEPCPVLPKTCDSVHAWRDAQGHIYLPTLAFATSLDACFAPGGPVEYATHKDRAWFVALWPWTYAQVTTAKAFHDATDPNPARALCLAFLAAVEQEEKVG